MKYIEEFPQFKTKMDDVTETFDLSTPEGRKDYFEAKAGTEITKLKEHFKENSFIAYLLAKKSAGKGTYTKLMREIFGDDVIGHISVGDVVRAAYEKAENPEEKDAFLEDVKKHYRGYISFEDAVDALLGRSQDKLLPTEFILALVKKEIDAMPRKTLFIDGFPRELDQISYALFFRDLVDYRYDPDVFIAIDVPESVIDERMKYRVICPTCKTPRNTKLLATRDVDYDEATGEFHLLCDEHGERMVAKEGDADGIKPIKARLDKDGELIEKMFSLHGVPKIFVRNAVPVEQAEEYVDNYELTPMYSYEWDADAKKAITKESPWTAKDDEGVEVYSLLAPPALVSLVKQLVKILDL